MKRILFVMFLMLMGALPMVKAQDGLEPPDSANCPKEAIAEQAAILLESIAEGSETLVSDILQFNTFAETVHFFCAGFTLRGDVVEGKSSYTVGPLVIPAGVYRATLTAEDTFIMGLTKVDGSCPLVSLILTEGQATNGAEDVVSVRETCTAILDVNAQGPWEWVLEPLQ